MSVAAAYAPTATYTATMRQPQSTHATLANSASNVLSSTAPLTRVPRSHSASAGTLGLATKASKSKRRTAAGAAGAGASRDTAVVSSKLLTEMGLGNVSPQKEAVVISDRELGGMMSLTRNGNGRPASTGSVGGNGLNATSTSALAASYSSSIPLSVSMSRSSAVNAALSPAATRRKERMQRFDRETRPRFNVESERTPGEIEEEEKKKTVMNKAKKAMEEEHDDVKHMNQMMLYAQCVTIRDAQILEKVSPQSQSPE